MHVEDVPFKPLEFMGSADKDLRVFPKVVKRNIGFDLGEVQAGRTPLTAKRLKGFRGVLELVERYDKDTYRAVYVADLGYAVYVLHCFKKKSKRGIATPKPDIDLIRERLKQAQVLAKGAK